MFQIPTSCQVTSCAGIRFFLLISSTMDSDHRASPPSSSPLFDQWKHIVCCLRVSLEAPLALPRHPTRPHHSLVGGVFRSGDTRTFSSHFLFSVCSLLFFLKSRLSEGRDPGGRGRGQSHRGGGGGGGGEG